MNCLRGQLPALFLLGGALLLFGAFHGMPVVSSAHTTISPSGTAEIWESQRGYTIWESVISMMSNPGTLDIKDGIVCGALFAATMITVASPFLTVFLVKSRLLWWMFLVFSCIGVLGISVMFLVLLVTDPWDPETTRIGPGMAALIVFPLLHFAGILLVRRTRTEAGGGA